MTFSSGRLTTASPFCRRKPGTAKARRWRSSRANISPLSQRILARDNCWERAYRHLMQAYNALGDRGQLARTYQRCLQTLKDELDVPPSQETQDLYRKLVHS